MSGGFDAAGALRAGLGDRQHAWEFIRGFAAEWTSPLAAGDGVSADVLRAAEQRLGVKRWFFAPGKLLRMDGRDPDCWLLAGGKTLTDLESIRETIPGPWTRVQWPD